MVETRTWTFVDKSDWPDGPWKSEPDKKQWQDSDTGLACLIHRGPVGALCGYVGVPAGHPFYKKNYNDLPMRCHGGLTYSELCNPSAQNPEHGICHIVEPEEVVWWIGFDCAHLGDKSPAVPDWGYQSYYRDFQYVEEECMSLAHQIKELADAYAKDQQVLNRNILTVGSGGAGKTAQVLTLKKPVFAYFFDAHALDTVQGYDIDYEEFLPDNIPLGVYSLSKKANEAVLADKHKRDRKVALRASDLYRAWEDHFEKACDNGDFEGVHTIMFDSLTMFGDLVMDEILRINGRPGQWPQQDDYGPAINAIRNVFRRATSMKKQLYVCAHGKLLEDELSHKVFYQLAVFGQLRSKLPLMFGHILPLSAEADAKGNVQYLCQTRPDKYWHDVRTTMRGCAFKENVEIDWAKDPVGQGLGGLLERYNAFGNRPNSNVAQATATKE